MGGAKRTKLIARSFALLFTGTVLLCASWLGACSSASPASSTSSPSSMASSGSHRAVDIRTSPMFSKIIEEAQASSYIPLFVYGPLLQNQEDQDVLSASESMGVAVLPGYSIYEIDSAVGLKKGDVQSEEIAVGELLLVNAETLGKLAEYEDPLSDYSIEPVSVMKNGSHIDAYAFMYQGDLGGQASVPVNEQPKFDYEKLKDSYIWYVCYGSNLLRERFMLYVAGGVSRFDGFGYDGCSDTTAPLETRAFEIPYDIYFANRSGSWDNCGAAFVDVTKPGLAYGRAYLVTKDQYKEIHEQEGNVPNWYCDELDLGELEGIPCITFTNNRRLDSNGPSGKYLDVIREGLKEIWQPALSDEDIEDYIAAISER